MSEATDKTAAWAKELGAYSAASWERLPEIYLYMDQVLTYLQGQFPLLERGRDSALLTSSMINNYVKDGVLPRPEQKKYSREHLALLTLICMLKQVLSIQDISVLLHTLLRDASPCEVYAHFCGAQESAFKEVSSRVQEQAPQGEAELMRLAIELSVEANARRTAAERIISEVSAPAHRPAKAKKAKENEA